MTRIASVLVGLGLLLVFAGCSTLDIQEFTETIVEEEGDRVYIVDQTGKRWDVTHAFKKYGMRPDLFQYGLGPYAIRPITDPVLLEKGDRQFLPPDALERVIGTTINGESRAYSIDDLNAHEIVDDVFGDVYVAIGW